MSRGAVTVDDLEIHWTSAGAGPELMLLHGFAGSTATMQPLIEHLAPESRVIAVDLVGHGASSRPHDPAAYGLESVLDQLGAVADEVAAGTIHLAGYSMGGRIALAWAAREPERFRSVAAISASTGISDHRRRDERARSDEVLARNIEQRGVGWFVDYWSGLPILQLRSEAGRSRAARLNEQRARNDQHALAHALRGLGQGTMGDVAGVLGSVAVPVLFVVGELDTKYLEIARAAASSLPGASCVIVPGAGHIVPLDDPERLAAELTTFAKDVDARATT